MSSEEKKVSRRGYVKYAGAAVVVVAVGAAGAYYATQPPAPPPTTPVVTTPKPTTPVPTTPKPTTPVPTTPTKPTGKIRVVSIQDPFWFSLQLITARGDFTQKTGIEATVEGVAYDKLHAEAVNSFLRKMPGMDVISVDNMWLGEWGDNEWLIPLDDYIIRDKEEVNMKDMIPNVMYTIDEWRGKIISFPVAPYTQGVIYRVDVFDELGLKPPPKDPKDSDWWTWDKYMEYVKAINGRTVKGTKYYGTCIAGVQPAPITHMYTQLAASKGVRWFKQFPEAPWDFTPTVNVPENVKALQYYIDLYKHSPPEAINYVWFDVGTQFGVGNIGMIFWWSPYFYLVNKAGYMTKEDSAVGKNGKMDPEKYDCALLPHEPGVPQCYSVSAWSLGIPKYAANPDASWEFIKWAGSFETQKKMGLYTEPSPYQMSDFARYSLYEDPELLEVYPYLPVQLLEMTGWEGITATGKYTRPCMPLYFTLEGMYGLHLNLAVAGKMTAEAALETVDTLWTTTLKENLYLPYLRESYDDTLDRYKKETLQKFL